MKVIEAGDVVLFDYYGQEVVGIVIGTRFYPASPCASSVRLYSPDTTYIHQHSLFGSFRTLFQPDYRSTRRAILRIAERDYKAHLMRYPVWRERFEQDPEYPIWDEEN